MFGQQKRIGSTLQLWRPQLSTAGTDRSLRKRGAANEMREALHRCLLKMILSGNCVFAALFDHCAAAC
jgi:hypothetical protein